MNPYFVKILLENQIYHNPQEWVGEIEGEGQHHSGAGPLCPFRACTSHRKQWS